MVTTISHEQHYGYNTTITSAPALACSRSNLLPSTTQSLSPTLRTAALKAWFPENPG
jgi:hypothetical protein